MKDELIKEELSGTLICESCESKFFCGVNDGECWCFSIDLASETLTDLREKYKNCLCENCLKELSLRKFEPENIF